MFRDLLLIYGMVVIYYVVVVNVLYFLILVLLFCNIWIIFRWFYYFKYNILLGLELVFFVFLLVFVYNEELMIIENVNCLMMLNYLMYEVIVVNDGFSDSILNVLLKEFCLKFVMDIKMCGKIFC